MSSVEHTTLIRSIFVNLVFDKLKLCVGIKLNLKTENHVRAYAETMKALKFDDDGPNIQYKDFGNHFHLFFDLTSTQEANVEMHFPDVVGAGIRLELYFANNLTNTVELFVSGERISSIAIDKEGSVTKNG